MPSKPDPELMSFQEIGRRLGYKSWSTPVYLYNRAMAKLRKRFTHGEILSMLRDLAAQESDTSVIAHARVRVAMEANLIPHPTSSWELWISPGSRLCEWEKKLLES